MDVKPSVKFFNAAIGIVWAVIGVLLFTGSLAWFASGFFADVSQTLIYNIPVPATLFGFVRILGLTLLGGFFLSWGGAMVRRQEWGAFAGGLTHVVGLGVFILSIVIFLRDALRWLDVAALSLYNRYAWFIWGAILVIGIGWVVTIWFLIGGKNRREYYAAAYQIYPDSGIPVCAQCGLKLEEGRCPEHDRLKRDAYLQLGDRRETLVFTEDFPRITVGRYKEGSDVSVYVYEMDAEKDKVQLVSAKHIAIQYNFVTEEFTVEDLASTNKTYLNDGETPLSPNIPYTIVDGTRIRLAHAIELSFEC